MKNSPSLTSAFATAHSWLRFLVVAALFLTGALSANPAQAGLFSGQHFSNASLSGTPTNTSQTSSVAYNWGSGAPNGLPNDFFSNRWTATIPCAGGQYTFHVRADDGVRLYIDGNLLIDGWVRQTSTEGVYSAVSNLSAGNHTIVLEHYEYDGVSSISLNWEYPGNSGVIEPITGNGDGPIPLPAPIVLNKVSSRYSSSRIYLVWTGGEGSNVYHIKRRIPGSTSNFNQLPDIFTLNGANQYSCDFEPNDASQAYEYIVIGSNAQGNDRLSDTVILPKPLALKDFFLSGNINGTTVSLTWTGAIDTPVGRDDWRYVFYQVYRSLKNSNDPFTPVPGLSPTNNLGQSFQVASATTPYNYQVIASYALTSGTKTSNVVTLPKPRVWSTHTPIGEYKNSSGVTVYDGRLIAPVNQTATNFIPAPFYVVAGASIPCGVELASDVDYWTKEGQPMTSGTEADVIGQPNDYLWSYSGQPGGGFRARGSSDAPAATLVGREVEFVVPGDAAIDTDYNLTCKISNLNGTPISPDDEGNRTDATVLRTQQLRVSGSSSALKVYRFGAAATTNTAAVYNELGDTIGGEVYVALHIDLGVNDRVTSPKARVRIQELADAANGIQHAANEDHVDVSVLLNDKTGWQEFYDPDGSGSKQPGWWAARKSPGSSVLGTENLKFRYLIKWETSEVRTGDRFDVSQVQSGKVLGHNGNHKLVVSSVNSVIGAPIAFAAAGSTQTAASFAKTVEVSNLSITDVSTSNGTSDYFKFDPTAPDGSDLKSPTVSFKIEDDGDANRYAWKVRVRSTDSEEWDGVAISGVCAPGQTVTARVNDFSTSGQTQVGDTDSNAVGAYKVITQWGTYSFDIEVKEVDNAGALLGDAQNVRSKLFLPYFMPLRDSQGNYYPGHGGELVRGADGIDRYYLNYYIKDEGTLTPTQPALSDLQIQMLSPDMGAPVVTAPTSWGKNVNTAYTNQLLHTFTTPREAGTYITTFTGTDNYKAFYRDHLNRKTLTKNDRASGTIEILNDTRNGDRVVSAKDTTRALPGGEKVLHVKVYPVGATVKFTLTKKSGETGSAVFGGAKLADGTRPELGTTLTLTGIADPADNKLAATQEIVILGRSVSSVARNMALRITAADGTAINNWNLDGVGAPKDATGKASWDFTVFRVDVTFQTQGDIRNFVPDSVKSGGGNDSGSLATLYQSVHKNFALGCNIGEVMDIGTANTTSPDYYGGIAFKGTIFPNGMAKTDFNLVNSPIHSFDWSRRISNRRYKSDGTFVKNPDPQVPIHPKLYVAQDLNDSLGKKFKDLVPDSDGAANSLAIWDVDAPNLVAEDVPSDGDIARLRMQFFNQAKYAGIVISKKIPWFFRASVKNPVGPEKLVVDTSLPASRNDNQVMAGDSALTSLTVDLATSTVPVFTVTSVLPQQMTVSSLYSGPNPEAEIAGSGFTNTVETRAYATLEVIEGFDNSESREWMIEVLPEHMTFQSTLIKSYWGSWDGVIATLLQSSRGIYKVKVIRGDKFNDVHTVEVQ